MRQAYWNPTRRSSSTCIWCICPARPSTPPFSGHGIVLTEGAGGRAQAIAVKLTERLAVQREQFGRDPAASLAGSAAAANCCGCRRQPPRAAADERSARGGELRATEAACRALWEVPAWEGLLLQADCAARGERGAAPGPGRLFVFEDAWVFAPDRPAGPRRRRGPPPPEGP